MPRNCYTRGPWWWARGQVQGQEIREPLNVRVADTPEHVAEQLAAEWLDAKRAEARGDAPTRTYDEIATLFILERLPELREKGAKRYRSSLRNLTPFFEGKRLGEINADTLRVFEKARRAGGASTSTVRRDLHCLSAAITFFGDENDLDIANPVSRYLRRRARQGALREGDARTRYLSHDEEVALLEAARARADKDRRVAGLAEAIEFAIDTGARLEEQFGMKWQDVSQKREEIRIRSESAKGGKGRVIPLFERSAQILAQLPRPIEGGWIWRKRDGSRFNDRTDAFKTACKAAGIKDLLWHDLRRTCGCRRLQDQGWSMEQVCRLLGHASVTITEKHYAFLEVENLKGVGTKTGTAQAE
ncbi:MAG: tyrosine-type recombinase/integrase [Pseudomonadota bacterium]